MSLTQQPSELQEHVIEGRGRAKILLLDVSGFISSQQKSGTFGLEKRPSLIAEIRESLQKAESDSGIAGVIPRWRLCGHNLFLTFIGQYFYPGSCRQSAG